MSDNKKGIANQTYNITVTALMAALVFTGTFYFKIPTSFGYTHLGDCMIILTVCLLGTKRGALAGAIGAGLSDLLGGYAVWVLPTVIFKGLWALIMGLIAYKLMPKFKFGWLVGAIVGGIVHIICYTLIKIPIYGMEYAIVRIPVITGQTICGIVIGSILYLILYRIPAIRKLAK